MISKKNDTEIPNDKAVPIKSIEQGKTVVVKRIDSGHQMKHRLAEMGIIPGEEIDVVKNETGFPVIIRVKETKLMLGKGMCGKIMVSEEDE